MAAEKLTTYQRCAAQHFGPWAIEPRWFAQAVAAVKDGSLKPRASEDGNPPEPPRDDVVYEIVGDQIKVLYWRKDGVALVPITDQITKGDSSFGGCSSVRTRRAMRMAANDDAIRGIMLLIDSPGGTCAGTGDLAADVRAAGEKKPVHAYIEDQGCSAAYWIASQAAKVSANATGMIGSIGTFTYLEDSSGMYEMAGVKVHLVSTGQFKGAWVDGLPISDEYIATVQQEVDDLNSHFLAGVLSGRAGAGMTSEGLAAIADGRTWIASKAKELRLIDEVSTLDAAMAALRKEFAMEDITREQFDGFAAKHPEAVQPFIDQGRQKGLAEGKAAVAVKPATAAELKAAFPGESDFVLECMEKQLSMQAAEAAYAKVLKGKLEASQKQVKELQAEVDQANKVLGKTRPPVAGGVEATDMGGENPLVADAQRRGEAAARRAEAARRN